MTVRNLVNELIACDTEAEIKIQINNKEYDLKEVKFESGLNKHNCDIIILTN